MICPYFYPNAGGMENYAYNIAEGLTKKGHKITVLCATKSKKDKIDIVNGIKIIRQKPDIIISNTPIKFNLYFTISTLLKENKIELVNAHTPVPYYADMACYAAKRHNVPFLLTYHNDNVHPNVIVNALCNVYNYTLNTLTLSLSTEIITPSPFCFNESKFLKKHKNKLSWIPPGIDLERFRHSRSSYVFEKYKLPKDSKIILFIGQLDRFHKHKGVDVLIGAFSDVCKTTPNIYLVLVGKGDAKEYMVQCKQQNIEKNVIFAGFVEDNTLPKYYQSADVLVLPTITKQEGFGMTLIEAMACGTPVIGTKVGGIPYLIRDKETGLLVERNDSKSLRIAIEQLLYKKNLIKKVEKNAFKIVKEMYQWEKIVLSSKELFSDYHKEVRFNQRYK